METSTAFSTNKVSMGEECPILNGLVGEIPEENSSDHSPANMTPFQRSDKTKVDEEKGTLCKGIIFSVRHYCADTRNSLLMTKKIFLAVKNGWGTLEYNTRKLVRLCQNHQWQCLTSDCPTADEQERFFF